MGERVAKNLVLSAILWSLLASLAAAPGDRPAEALPSRIVIAPPGEPGQPLIVVGTVYGPDGRTPAPGVVLELHHTDARGYYSRDGKNEEEPRLKGRLRTDGLGRYEFSTIKPAPYPSGGNPAHIHIKASGGGYPEQHPHEYWFRGDPTLIARILSPFLRKGNFSPVCPNRPDPTGVLRCRRDIRVQTASAAR